MKATLVPNALASSLLLATIVSAHYPIPACEQPEISYVSGNGNEYLICPASDYQGTTLYDYHNYPSAQACAQACSTYQGCTQAVYDTVGLTCHIKGASSGLAWVANDQGSQTIRQVAKSGTQGAPLNACPYSVPTHISSQGWHYQICPFTDYAGTTLWDVHDLNSDQDCANACGQYKDCHKAVYDIIGKTCHFKAACDVQLVANPNSDSIIFLDRPNAPKCGGTTTTVASTTTKTTAIQTTSKTVPSTTTCTTTSTTSKPATTTTTTTTSKPVSTTTTTSKLVSTTTTTTTTTTAPASSGLCANGAAPDYTYTASNGDIYGVCKNTDFPGGDILSPVFNIPTIEACADVCSRSTGCVAVNLHRDPQICYLKGVKTNSIVNNAVDGAYLMKAVSGGPTAGTTTTSSGNQPTTCPASTVTVTVTKGYRRG